jgi:deoxyadenosine/deoxycytidine kinase
MGENNRQSHYRWIRLIIRKCQVRLTIEYVDTVNVYYKNMNGIVVSLEGNIAAGKTTVINNLRKLDFEIPVEFHLEPTQWVNDEFVGGKSLLELFDTNPVQWSYLLQIEVLKHWNHVFRKLRPNIIHITERSMYTGAEVFVPVAVESHYLQPLEQQSFDAIFEIAKDGTPKVDRIIYIETQPTTCMDRLKLRGRESENKISIDYLAKLDASYRRWIAAQTVPVLVINGEIDAKNDEYGQWLHRARDFLL